MKEKNVTSIHGDSPTVQLTVAREKDDRHTAD
jgi:hypothetical protein